MKIRPEKAGDEQAIAAVVVAAFRSDVEARFVADLRRSAVFIPELALVAEAEGTIVGHVMITYAELHESAGDARRWPIASLAPLAVAPPYQRQGIGGALVEEAVAGAEARGEPLVIVQGDPRYYGRFGFEPAARHGITMELPTWAPPEAAQVLRLSRYDPSWRGQVAYPIGVGGVADH